MQELIRRAKLVTARTIFEQLVVRGTRGDQFQNDERIVVAGLFSTASGIGECARLCRDGLRAENVDVEAIDLSWVFSQQDMAVQPEIPKFLQRPGTGGTLILQLNAPETMIALWKMGLRRHHRNWRIIGFWAWELENLPDSWGRAFKFLSEIWVPSKFVENAISSETNLQVKVVPPAVLISTQEELKPTSAQLTFLTMGDAMSSFERKNILGSIKAYLTAFPKPVNTKLIVKCRNQNLSASWLETAKDLTRGREDIEFLLESLSKDQMREIISDTDVLISLHKSEGFGLAIAEAIAKNKIVICTSWSGNMEFTNDSNACLVNFTKTALVDPYGVYPETVEFEWAEPDIDHAAMYIRDIFDRPDFYQDKFAKSQQSLIPKLSTKNYAVALWSH